MVLALLGHSNLGCHRMQALVQVQAKTIHVRLPNGTYGGKEPNTENVCVQTFHKPKANFSILRKCQARNLKISNLYCYRNT